MKIKERIKSKNVTIMYLTNGKSLSKDIVKKHILEIGMLKKNIITIQNIEYFDGYIQVRFSFDRKSNYPIDLFNITYNNINFEPVRQKSKIINERKDMNFSYSVYSLIVECLIELNEKKEENKHVRGKYILVEYNTKPSKIKYISDEEYIIWNDPIKHLSWFVLIKFNTRLQKWSSAYFELGDNIKLLSTRVLTKDYYEILRKIIHKLELVDKTYINEKDGE